MKGLLSTKQQIILKAIRSYFAEHHAMPTIRQLRDETNKSGLGLKSLRSFFNYLNDLEAKGYISRNSGRGLELKGISKGGFVDIPVLGTANAGAASVFAQEYIEGYLKVSKNLVRNRDVFAVQISGTSMNKAKVNGKTIDDGDFVLVDATNTNYRNGDRVLVVIDGLATVKTYRSVDGRNIVLWPESTEKKHKPIFLTQEDNFVVNGKIVNVLKVR
jgi:repressor LexA